MHSPRLQMKKKGDLSPRTLPPTVSSGARLPVPNKTASVPIAPSAGEDSTTMVTGMTSDALAGLIGKYRTSVNDDVHITAAELAGNGGPSRTAQEIARVAQALSPPKPDNPAPPDPYQEIGSRVFDFMKKPGGVVVPHGALSPRLYNNNGPSKPVGALEPLLHHTTKPIAIESPPALFTQQQQLPSSSARRSLAPINPAAGGSSGMLPALIPASIGAGLPSPVGVSSARIPAAPPAHQAQGGSSQPYRYPVSPGQSAGGSGNSRYIAVPDESSALVLVPAASTTSSGGGAITIVQSPHDAPPPPPRALSSGNAASELLQAIEATTNSESDGGAFVDTTVAPAPPAASFMDPEVRRARLANVLNGQQQSSLSDGVGVGTAKTRLEIAKLKNHIAFLTQQLLQHMACISAHAPSPSVSSAAVPTGTECSEEVADASGPFDVTIAQSGRVVWKASTQEVDEALLPLDDVERSVAGRGKGGGGGGAAVPSKGEDAGEEAWLLSDGGGDEEDPKDISVVKARARKAYIKAISTYKTKITQQRDVIAKLKVQLESTQPGGSKYTHLEEDLQIVREECRKQIGKIKTLVSLLDRAGQTIRFHEDQRHADAMGNVIRKENAAQWSQVRRIMPALDVEPPRTDAQILTDVVRFMDQQEDKIAEFSSHTEQLTQQLEDAQAAFDALQRTTKALQRDLEQTKFELEALRQRRKFEQEERSNSIGTANISAGTTSSSGVTKGTIPGGGLTPPAASLLDVTSKASESESERARLIERISSLESALKASTETKQTFEPLGVAEYVPPFLRYPNTAPIRNIHLSKMEVENIICGIWLTRFLASVSNSKPIADSGWICDASSPAAAAPSTSTGSDSNGRPQTSNFANGAAVVRCLERMFTIAVQASFTAAGGSSGIGSASNIGGLAHNSSSSGGLITPSSPRSTTAKSAPSNLLLSGLQLSPDRHPACDFMDDNNLSMWQVKRSEAKRMVNMIDHVTRFFLECVQPSACKTCLTLYTVGSGITTPPIATLQWQKRTELFLQCPQLPVLFRGKGTPVPEAVAEMTYSFVDGCEKYNFDGDINMFRRVLQDELPEAAYFDMMLMIEKLRAALINSHTLYSPPYRWPTPTVATVLHMLKRFFPKKSKTSLLQLQRSLLLDMKESAMNTDSVALTRMMRSASNASAMMARDDSAAADDSSSNGGEDQKMLDLPPVAFGMDDNPRPAIVGAEGAEALRTPVDVPRLFASTESGNQGYFLETLKSQYMNEIMRYTQEVREAVVACGEELLQQQSAKESAPVMTGISMIDAQPLSTLEKSKKRRSTVASYFQKQLAALTASDSDAGGGGGGGADGGIPDVSVPLRVLGDKLQLQDPAKSAVEVETYIYHVLQLYFLVKSKKGLSLSSSAAPAASDDDGPPTTGGGLTPAETELFSLSREELWKRQTRAASYAVPVQEFVRFCPKVFYRRASVDFYEQTQ